METRVNVMEKGQTGLKTLFAMGGYLKKSTVARELLELINFRVSQINNCAYCMDMHAKDARALGETEQRLYSVSVWREVTYYTERERAALQWAEAVNSHHVPQEIFEEVRVHLSEDELIDITFAVGILGIWNKLNCSFFPMKPGSYTVGQFS